MKTIEITDAAFTALALFAAESGFPASTLASAAILHKLAPQPSPPARTQAAPGRVILSFSMPVSEIRDFRAHMADSGRFGGKERNPELYSVIVGTRDWEKRRPFDKPCHGVPSSKMRLARIKRLMKAEPCETLSIDVPRAFCDEIVEAAKYYGITPEEHCQSCLAYHAALWRKQGGMRQPDSAMERFKRNLAADALAYREAKAGIDN